MKKTVGCQQISCNLVLIHFRLFITSSQLLDAGNHINVNSKLVDKFVAKLPVVHFAGSSPNTNGRMSADAPMKNTTEVVKVVHVNRFDDDLRRSTRYPQAPSRFQ